jgi:hypothetical protein
MPAGDRVAFANRAAFIRSGEEAMLARTVVVATILWLWTAVPVQAQSTSTIYGSAFSGSSGASTLYTIDATTGAATVVGPIGVARVGALAFGPNGKLYGVGFDTTANDSVLITINPATGAGTVVGLLGADDATQDIAFRPGDGKLFAYVGGSIYTIDTATGVGTLVGDTGDFPDGNAIVFAGGTLYLANSGGGGANGTLQTINQATGAVTDAVAFTYGAGFTPANNPRAAGMKFDAATGILYAVIVEGSGPSNTRFLATINTATGAVTDIGTSVAGLDALAIAAAATPPSPVAPVAVPALSEWALITMALMLALVTLARRARRRR